MKLPLIIAIAGGTTMSQPKQENELTEDQQHLQKACVKLSEQYQLTPAEQSILLLLSQGHKPKQIAALRCRNIETIRTQVKSIREKLQAYRVGQVVEKVIAMADACSHTLDAKLNPVVQPKQPASALVCRSDMPHKRMRICA